jgi:hypothetical protein
MEIFVGRVKALKSGFGFIDKETVRWLNGSQHYYCEKDIFFHLSDFKETISEREYIRFIIKQDPVRKNAYRAYPLKALPIELHIDETAIDYTMVHLRWCIEPVVVEEMKQTPRSTWYIAIVGQLSRTEAGFSDEKAEMTAVHFVVGVEDIADGRGYMEFYAPGTHDLVAYLVQSQLPKNQLKAKLKQFDSFDHVDVWDNWEEKILSQYTYHLGFLRNRESNDDIVLSNSRMIISLPEEIFAKPRSKPVSKLLSYYGVTTSRKNTCKVNKRVLLTCILGLPWLIVWETLKRTTSFLVGLGHLCLGGNPLNAWRCVWARQLSAPVLTNVWGTDEYEPLTNWEGTKVLYHPFPLLVLFGFLSAMYALPDMRLGFAIGLSIMIGLIGAGFLFRAFNDSSYFDRLLKYTVTNVKHYWQKKEAQSHAELFTRLDTYVVCHKDSPPPQVKTVRLIWSGIKRRVCRT